MTEKKLSFSKRDEFGNELGTCIELLPTITPEQILEIGEYYKNIGWEPNRATKRVFEEAKATQGDEN